MKLIIFGSTGGTGRQIVAQALEQGHEVTAFARSPEKLDQKHEKLKVVQGNVLDFASLERAIQGQDVVLCTLGLPPMDKSNLRANGTKNIIRAMEKTGVKRFICQSSAGVGDSSDTLPFPVHGRDPGFEANVDAGPIVEVCRFDVEPLRGQLPGEELFRQRRALVRQPGFLADEHDRAVEAFLLQRGDDLSRGVTRTRNYDLLRQGTVPSAYQTGCSGQKKGNNIITAMNTTMVSGTPTLR